MKYDIKFPKATKLNYGQKNNKKEDFFNERLLKEGEIKRFLLKNEIKDGFQNKLHDVLQR